MFMLIKVSDLVEKLSKNSIFKGLRNAEDKTVYDMIEDCPKYDEPADWIPVSEGLPQPVGNEMMVDVEVTIKGEERNIRLPAFYFFHTKQFFYQGIGQPPIDNVIAWYPLLEPYNGTDEK